MLEQISFRSEPCPDPYVALFPDLDCSDFFFLASMKLEKTEAMPIFESGVGSWVLLGERL